MYTECQSSAVLTFYTTTGEKCNHLEFARWMENARNSHRPYRFGYNTQCFTDRLAVESLGNFRVSMNGDSIFCLASCIYFYEYENLVFGICEASDGGEKFNVWEGRKLSSEYFTKCLWRQRRRRRIPLRAFSFQKCWHTANLTSTCINVENVHTAPFRGIVNGSTFR